MKILIVDDESTVHDQLAAIIPWKELGWAIVGHAYNGEEAKRLTEVHRPNLIITDIRMPLTDGLEFMSWLEYSELFIKIIVLSGYGEFEYSRQAFKRGAYDYLLKPIQESELLIALGKAVEQIREDSRFRTDRLQEKAVLAEGLLLKQDEFLTQIIGGHIKDENEMHVQAQRLLLSLPEEGSTVVVVRFVHFDDQVEERFEGDRPSFYYAARKAISELMGATSIVFRNLYQANEYVIFISLLESNARESILRRLQRSLASNLKMPSQIGVSLFKQRAAKLSSAYMEAQHALESLRVSEEGEIAVFDPGSRPYLRRSSPVEAEWKEIGFLFDMLAEGGSLRDKGKLLTHIQSAFQEDMLAEATISEWKKAVAEFVHKLEQQPMNEEMRTALNEARTSLRALRFQRTMESLLSWMEDYIAIQEEAGKGKSGKTLIDAIQKYIAENYRTMSLEQISERFHLNKNYFCTLFKNATGQSFMEYVIGIRMEQAMKLLRESTLRTYEIADAVGYTDQRYFSQVFRKYTGLQPTQYRMALSNKIKRS
ncbi:response regulator [Cohnella lubricantis]|uniref:Response regulator n=1 Tax=Cohnella lubricantis TaxID=2163172 RepID=A0A841TG57_9BACL|nr:response regulator [Cohnella lubricantis]MBB6677927.1 response regulator [Cohnella lubricantis]MBP2120332.1 two-component system response regulator YesN [Cohnella lubricantis]